ncbi:MAG TPA: DMT family transporter [Anaerovoracaceae bacterium]|nr:DMT family transporter [Anaerovoracaceae bacterium]
MNKTRGIIYMLAAAMSFALMFVMVYYAGDVPTLQKVFFRNAIAFFVAVYVFKRKNIEFNIDKKGIKALVIRSVVGLIAVICNFYAVDHLILADANILTNTNPFFAIIFSYFLLKEKVKPYQIVAIIIAFIGCLFVIKPSFVVYDYLDALIGLLGGMLAGAAYAYLRKIGLYDIPKSYAVAFFAGFCCLALLPFLIFNYSYMTTNQWAILILAGIFATSGQFFVTGAYYHAPARDVSVYMYTQVLFTAGFGLILFDQVPDVYSIIGYMIIISMGIFMYFKKRKENEINS